MQSRTRIALVAVLLLLPLAAAQAVPLHWTAVGSAGTVDPTFNNAGGYVYTGAGIGFGSSGNFSIVARYNVVNPTGTETPAWTTLEMGYTDPTSGGGVSTSLVQVDPCTGNTTTICSISSTTATGSCRSCTFANTTFNFSTKLYYVQVSLNRPSGSSVSPVLYTLRLF
jgi:hypothetical protein